MSQPTPSPAPDSSGPPADARERLRHLFEAHRKEIQALLDRIKAHLPELNALLDKVSSHWHGEDGFYRFYHQSFKVYRLQEDTIQIVAALRALAPERPLNPWFEQIVREGTGKEFRLDHNQRWLEETRPILEAFFHARTLLELAVRYGRELGEAPQPMPSGWAAVLYLFNLR